MRYNKLTINALAKIGLTIEVGKISAAAGISYALALLLSNNPYPIFAPLAAILTMQVTIADSIEKGLFRTLGVVFGVGIGDIILKFFTISTLSVFIAMLLGYAFGTAFKLNKQIISQIGVSSLLVLGYGQAQGYMWGRIVETIIGAVIAIGISALVYPLDPIAAIKQAILQLTTAMENSLRSLQKMQSAEDFGTNLTQTRLLVKDSERECANFLQSLNALRFSPFHLRQKKEILRLAHAINKIERLTIQIRGIARGLYDLKTKHNKTIDITDILQDCADCFQMLSRIYTTDSAQLREELLAALQTAGHRQSLSYMVLSREYQAEYLPEIGSIFADLDRIHSELESLAGNKNIA